MANQLKVVGHHHIYLAALKAVIYSGWELTSGVTHSRHLAYSTLQAVWATGSSH